MSCLTLWPHGLQQGRLACPSPSPRVRSDSRPLCWQYSLTILPSTAPFFCPQSFPASGSFPISRLFASGPWRRKWQPTSLFLPGKSHGMRIPVGYSPWGCKESGHDWATSLSLSLWIRYTKFCSSIPASASVPSVNIQGWFPLGLTGLIKIKITCWVKIYRQL